MRTRANYSDVGAVYSFIGWAFILIGAIIGLASMFLMSWVGTLTGWVITGIGVLAGLPLLAVSTALQKLSEIAYWQAQSNELLAKAIQELQGPIEKPKPKPLSDEILSTYTE